MREQKNLTSTQGLNPSAISSYFVFSDYQFKIKVTKIKIEEQSIAGDALIWGNETLGTWGEEKWGSADVFAFTLGHPTAGTLGTSTLGGVLNPFVTIQEINLTQSIPNIARKEVMKWIAGTAAEEPVAISVGSDSTAYNSNDLRLGEEITRKIVSANIGENKKVSYLLEISSVDTEFQDNVIREVGLGTNPLSLKSISVDDFTTTTYKDTIDTTATWDGTGQVIFGAA